MLNETEPALSDLEKALALDPKFSPAMLQRGAINSASHQYDRALADFNQVLSLNPQEGDAYFYSLELNLKLGHDDAALEAMRTYLKQKGWSSTNSVYAALFIFQIGRRLGQAGTARDILDQVAAKCDRSKWPYPITSYLRHELSAADLLSQAKDDAQQTEARCHIGLEFTAAGPQAEGLEHLRWVQEKGNKQLIEYTLAATELTRLRQGANAGQSK
jgi:lipoprotein NlpI